MSTVLGAVLAISNPYLDEFEALPLSYNQDPALEVTQGAEIKRENRYLKRRLQMTGQYSWAIPNENALREISNKCSRILDFGAGTGYWAHLLSDLGTEVRAVDDWSWGKPEKLWFPVETGSFEWLGQFDNSWCLLLVWPPRDTAMASRALRAWKGETLIYIGEWQRGSGDPEFFQTLVTNFESIDAIDIPRWWNRSDWVYIWRKR